jgi:hypothetical protein
MPLPSDALKPSVGRLVWYTPHGHSEQRQNMDALVAPALVTYVIDRDLGVVNLKVIWNGPAGAEIMTNVSYGDQPGQWRWPDRIE